MFNSSRRVHLLESLCPDPTLVLCPSRPGSILISGGPLSKPDHALGSIKPVPPTEKSEHCHVDSSGFDVSSHTDVEASADNYTSDNHDTFLESSTMNHDSISFNSADPWHCWMNEVDEIDQLNSCNPVGCDCDDSSSDCANTDSEHSISYSEKFLTKSRDLYRSSVEESYNSFKSSSESRPPSTENNTFSPDNPKHVDSFIENPVITLTSEQMDSFYCNHLSTDDAVSLDLANTLLQWRVPVYAFDAIIKWLKRSVTRHGFDPLKKLKSFKTFMDGIKQSMNANLPIPVTVPLEWGAKNINADGVEQSDLPTRNINVMTFNFRKEVINLLNQEFARESKNLVLNPDKNDWYKPYRVLPGQAIDEIMTGSCYQNYIKNVLSKRPDRANCYVKGIMLYIDGTPCDGSQRFSLEPLLFTFVDFKRKVRNQPEAWGYLGLVPDIYLSSKVGKTVASNDPKRSGESSRNFHTMLQTLLQPLLDIQETGIPDFPICIDDTMKLCTLLLPLFMVCADGLEADKLCIRKINYRRDCIRICSGCTCSCEDSDNTSSRFNCEFLKQSEIAELCHLSLSQHDPETQEEACNTLSQVYNLHRCNNAFFPFRYMGGDSHGIFGACPPCFSHVMEHGIYKRVIECFFVLLSSSVLYELDMIAIQMLCKCPGQSSRDRFPRITFAHGVTNTTKLTCKEMTGLMFSLAVITGTGRGDRLLRKRLSSKQGREDHKLSEESLEKLKMAREAFFSKGESVGSRITKVFSSLLCFQSWTKKKDGYLIPNSSHLRSSYQAHTDRIMQLNSSRASIKIMQEMIKTTIPRTEGNGWKNQKMHSMTHFPVFIGKFGSPRNYDTACMESNHKTLAKDPGFQAQKTVSSFLPQTANRIVEHLSIKRACHRFGIIKKKEFPEDDDDNVWGVPTPDFVSPVCNEGSSEPRNKVVGLKMKLVCQPSTYHDMFSPMIFHDHWWSGTIDKLPSETKRGREIYLRDSKRPFTIPGPARKYLCQRNGIVPGSTFIFTEVHRRLLGKVTIDGKPLYQSIRCHPNYKKSGPWFDWAEFCFHRGEHNGKDIVDEVPCKIISLFLNVQYVNGQPLQNGSKAFMGLSSTEVEEMVALKTEVSAPDGTRFMTCLHGEIHAVVHCCEYPRSEKDMEKDTCLMKCWSLEYEPSQEASLKRKRKRDMKVEYEPVIREVPLSSMSCPIFVVEEYPGICESHSPECRNVYHISEQIQWSQEFT